MANGIRTGDPRGFNKGRSSKFCEGSQVRLTPEEGRRTYRPKHCGNMTKDEDNSPKTLIVRKPSSQKFRQLIFTVKGYTLLICVYKLTYPATTCDCGRKFNSLRGTRIHKARWCEERNSPAGECKSIDGPMSQVYPHSIHKPIADHQRPGDIFCKPRI